MERKIYSFHNGKGIVKYDPMQIYTRLISKDVDLEGDLARIKSLALICQSEKPNQEMAQQAIESYNKLLDASRYAFKLEPYEGDDFGERGVTDEETFTILADFSEFMARQKKNGNPPPILPQSTE